ncbi:MAG: hypothetical protein KAI28_10745 [Sphingomonadales bacterium]|nr:hypothetical protein [Sphingomonadales bacterium]
MTLELAIDILLVFLLLGAVVSSFILNKHIQEFRAGQHEMADLIQKLDQATNKAEQSFARLKMDSSAVQESITSEVNKARAMADELSLITEAGDSLANSLEERLTGASARYAPSSPAGGENEIPQGDIEAAAVLEALKQAR